MENPVRSGAGGEADDAAALGHATGGKVGNARDQDMVAVADGLGRQFEAEHKPAVGPGLLGPFDEDGITGVGESDAAPDPAEDASRQVGAAGGLEG